MVIRARALALALFCGGCGGSSDGDDDSNGNGGSAGSANTAIGDAVARLEGALPLVCEQTEACYGTRCEGPAEGGLMARWPDATIGGLFITCFGEVAGQYPALLTWAECMAESEEDEAACLSSCPPTVDACLNAGNEAVAACRAGIETEADAIRTCVQEKCAANPSMVGCEG